METIQQTSLNLLERFNRWIQESVMVKLFSIGFLLLILLIPSGWIEDLMYERQQRATSAIDEVSEKWSGRQMLSGPVLVIPFRKQEVINRGKDGKEIIESVEQAFFLPEKLNVDGTVTPNELHRGLFDVVVYQSGLKIDASFSKPDFKSLGVPENQVLWNEAHLAMGITDHRGISENPVFKAGSDTLTAEPSARIGITVERKIKPEANADGGYDKPLTPTGNGIVARLPWTSAESFSQNVSITLDLKGSYGLDFVPSGKTTTVTLSGTWNSPSFDGEFLPASRDVNENGFQATWKVLHFNRPFAQQWIGENQNLSGADFGVKLLVPVDQYQKSMRTSKYSVLIILLTFMSLLLVEITQKIRIHPFQYILIGAALIIYYTLLLSFSEHIGYNLAYVISSIATVSLITLYSRTFFHSVRLSLLFCALLVIFYVFIYVIILQQDFSLLLGSIGLFLIVGTLMYFSRKVRWYGEASTLS